MKALDIIISKVIRNFGIEVIHRPVKEIVNDETGERREIFGEDKLIKGQLSQITDYNEDYQFSGLLQFGDYLFTTSAEYEINAGDYICIGSEWTRVVSKNSRFIKGVENYVEYLLRRSEMR